MPLAFLQSPRERPNRLGLIPGGLERRVEIEHRARPALPFLAQPRRERERRGFGGAASAVPAARAGRGEVAPEISGLHQLPERLPLHDREGVAVAVAVAAGDAAGRSRSFDERLGGGGHPSPSGNEQLLNASRVVVHDAEGDACVFERERGFLVHDQDSRLWIAGGVEEQVPRSSPSELRAGRDCLR